MGEARYPVNGMSWALLVDDAMDQHSLHRDRLFVLGSRIDTPTGWLRAGRAVHAVLLEATARGLVASLLTQVLEVADLRDRLVTALDLRGRPQALLRIGYPTSAVKRAPGRPLDDVLIELADDDATLSPSGGSSSSVVVLITLNTTDPAIVSRSMRGPASRSGPARWVRSKENGPTLRLAKQPRHLLVDNPLIVFGVWRTRVEPTKEAR